MTLPGGTGDAERITWYANFVDSISAPARAAAESIDELGDESAETAAELKLLEKQADRTGNKLALLAAKNKLARDATNEHGVSVAKLREEYEKITRAQDKHTKSWFRQLRTNKQVRKSWQDLQKAGQRLLKLLGSMLKIVGALAKALVILTIVMGVLGLVGVVVKAIPWIAQLVVELTSLLSLLFLLPTAIGVLVLSLATMALAFKGVGSAIAAGFGDDFRAYNEAINKLSPAAAAFVREVVAAKGPLKSLQRSVQEAFFGPLVEEVAPTLKTLIPIIGSGATKLAAAFSKIFGTIMRWARSPEGVRAIQAMFRSAELFASTFEAHLLPLLNSWTTLLEAIEPIWARLMNGMGRGMDRFSAWITEISTDGTLERWLDTAFETLKLIAALIDPLARIVLALAGTTDGGALMALVVFLETIAKWMESAEGQRQLIQFFSDWTRIIQSLEPSLYVLGDLLVVLSTALADIMEGGLAAAFVYLLQTIVDSLNQITAEDPNFWKDFGNALGTLVIAIADLMPHLIGFFESIIGWINDNPEEFAMLVQALIVIVLIIQLFMAVLPIITAIVGLVGGLVALGFSLGAAILIVLAVLAIVAGVVLIIIGIITSWGDIVNAVTMAWDTFFANVIDPIRDFFVEDLPGYLAAFGAALISPWTAFKEEGAKALEWLSTAWTQTMNALGISDRNGDGSIGLGEAFVGALEAGWNNLTGLFRFAGGGVEGGQQYMVNELGQEKFYNSLTGAIEDIGDGRMGKWVAPASGFVLPAGLSDRLDAVVAAAKVRGRDGDMDEMAALLARGGGTENHYDQRQYHLRAVVNQPASDMDVEQALRKAWRKLKREEAERK